MFNVYFFENKNPLLSQFLKRVPAVGEALTIKGRKGTVSTVTNIDEKNIHVQVILENVNKGKVTTVDNSKKKRR
ncbi:hypothetical protein [Ectobacillus funiculus]|uniref:Preprotein translocase subunit YajC n=1 Tax=Ectobacillus funiculus TaxID=137993 RepID=A0ABV5WMY8_9BACI